MKPSKRASRVFASLLTLCVLLSAMPVATADEAHTLGATPSEPIAPVPGITLPEADIPEEDVPEEEMPEVDVPDEDVPEENIPEEDIPIVDSPVDSPLVDIPVEKADTGEHNTQTSDIGIESDENPECKQHGKYEYEDLTIVEVHQLSETEHSVVYQKWLVTWCQYCGFIYSTAKTGFPFTEIDKHSWQLTDGTVSCDVCGVICSHASTDTETTRVNVNIDHKDNKQHTISYQEEIDSQCLYCGFVFDTSTLEQIYTVSEKHEWLIDLNTGTVICMTCEYVCLHAPAYSSSDIVIGRDNVRIVDTNVEEHTISYIERIEYCCEDCGMYVPLESGNEVTLTEKHDRWFNESVYSGTYCWTCKYLCPHDTDHATTSVERGNITLIDSDAKQHTISYQEVIHTDCRNCKNQFESQPSAVKTITEDHNWKNIKNSAYRQCEDCGYICEHPSSTVTEELDICFYQGNIRRKQYDELFHLYVYDRVGRDTCDICGKVYWDTVLAKDITSLEPHEFEDGVCLFCGYEQPSECTHPFTYIDYWWYEEAENIYVVNDNTSHTHIYDRIADETCMGCHEVLSSTVTRIEVSEKHIYGYYGKDENTCGQCDYNRGDCQHEYTISESSGWYDLTSVTAREDGHIFHISWEVFDIYCANCGQRLDSYSAGARDLFEEHTNPNGICYICGYDSSTHSSLTPTPASPTATPAPTRTPKPDSGSSSSSNSSSRVSTTVQNTDALFEPTPAPVNPNEMVNSLVSVIRQAQSQSFSVEIVGANELFSDEEYAQFRSLSSEEQLYVTLSSIGFTSAAEIAMQRMGISFSGSALSLMAQINQRIGQLSEEERAVHLQVLSEYFPTQSICENGTYYDYFVITLKIITGGTAKTQRYGFRYDNPTAQWVFLNLETV